jgi:hypothetical protein
MQDAGNATTVCARGQRMTTKLSIRRMWTMYAVNTHDYSS